MMARQERAVQGVRNNRVDQDHPAWSQPRASHGNGGGAFDPWTLLLLLPLLALQFKKQQRV